jgi:hypothetical protein
MYDSLNAEISPPLGSLEPEVSKFLKCTFSSHDIL